MDAGFRQRLIAAALVGPEGAAPLEQQGDAFEGRPLMELMELMELVDLAVGCGRHRNAPPGRPRRAQPPMAPSGPQRVRTLPQR